MKHFHLFIILGFFSLAINAQAPPGYLGKQLSIHGGMYFSPAFSNPNQNGSTGLAFNRANIFSLDYVISRTTSVELSYHQYNTQVNYQKFFDNKSNSYSFDNFSASGVNKKTRNSNGFIDAVNYGINVKLFSDGMLAPYGNFARIGLFYNKYSIENGRIFSAIEEDIAPINKDSYSGVFMSLGMGRQRIFFDFLILSYGMNFNIPISGGYYASFLATEVDYEKEKFLEQSSKNRLGQYHIINAYLTLGVLVF